MAVPKVCQDYRQYRSWRSPARNAKLLDTAAQELGQITGQKSHDHARAKKSIANFKIRKGMPIGCASYAARRHHVRISGPAMQHRSAARARLPADFHRTHSMGRGNYTLGLKDQLVFPEIDYTRVDKVKGMNITLTTTAKKR